jgi:hypothetical protein
MKYQLLYALLLGFTGCSVDGGSQASAAYHPTALDSATNGLYKVRQVKQPITPRR